MWCKTWRGQMYVDNIFHKKTKVVKLKVSCLYFGFKAHVWPVHKYIKSSSVILQKSNTSIK